MRATTVIARSEADEAIHWLRLAALRLDCVAEPVIGRRFAPTRWLAMTAGPKDMTSKC
jgi:hypothetical protein